MKSLDELAGIHPVVTSVSYKVEVRQQLIIFTTVAALAFKEVYALENTRQENDRRVVALYTGMKDMMMVMVQ